MQVKINIILLLVFLISSSIGAKTPSLKDVDVQYITSTKIFSTTSANFFTRTLGINFDTTIKLNGKNSTAGETDDTPLQLLPLNFPFQYYGHRTTSIWVNPNGGLQFIPKPPCGCCFSAMSYTGYCNFNSSYYNMLAISVTDLAPIDGPNCYVKYDTVGTGDDETFGLVFLDVPLFGVVPKASNPWTFGATLSKRGKIVTSYQAIYDTATPPSTITSLPSHVSANWLVGLRAPKAYNDKIKALNPHHSNRNQLTSWETSIKGSYPKRNEIMDGKYSKRRSSSL
jgi:hypothetical protein